MNASSSNVQMCSADNSIGPAVKGCRDDFDFTLRFEHVILSMSPSAVYIVFASLRIIQLSRGTRIVSGKVLQYFKLGVIISYSIVQLALLILCIRSGIESHNTAIAASALSVIVSLISTALSSLEHSRSLRPSILFSIYLFFSLLFDIAQSRSLLTISRSWALGRLFTAATCLKGVILLLENYSKTKYALIKIPSPESTTGIFSIATLSWLTPLLLMGSKKHLEVSDLYPLHPVMTSKDIDSKFWAAWNTPSSRSNNMHLLVTLVKVLKWHLLMPIPARAAKIAFSFCQPLLIQNVQIHLSKPQNAATAQTSRGLIGATVIIYLGLAVSTGIHQYLQQRAVTLLRGHLVTGIYRKTTVLRVSSDHSGASLTLISTDVERIKMAFQFIHEFWANSIEFSLAAWLLYEQLGIAFLLPIGVVLGCLIGTLAVGRVAPKLQAVWVTATQQRVSSTANVISNMKSLKISGLVSQLQDLVQNLREKEIKAGAVFRTIIVFSVTCSFAPQMISPVLMFAATRRDIDTTKAFTSLSFLLLLTTPLANLFQLIPTMIAATACFSRIANFLGAKSREDYRLFESATSAKGVRDPKTPSTVISKSLDRAEEAMLPETSGEAAFVITRGSWGWRENHLVLHDINTTIPKSAFTMLIGPVGSGKSTLCKALLGEVPFMTGQILCTSQHASIGFCDQPPFLPNASVRHVIIGLNEYDEAWYRRVVDAAALCLDIETFIDGDLSKVGPNGSSLSGGQRNRLAIARAIYARPSVFVFDDIFSGLDSETESIIFQKIFGAEGILREIGATSILCTHSVKHLQSADHIIALGPDGKIVEQGTYKQLNANESYVSSLHIHGSIDAGNDSDNTTISTIAATTWPLTASKLGFDDSLRQVGDFRVYKCYISSLKRVPLVFFGLIVISLGFCYNFTTIWLKYWSEHNTQHPRNRSKQGYYLGIYALLQLSGLTVLTAGVYMTNVLMTRRAGRRFHLQAIQTLMAAPLSLFTTTPPGVLLNRFSQDLNVVDTELSMHFSNMCFNVSVAIGMAAVIATASPYIAVAYPLLGGFLFALQKMYLKTSRQLRFMDLETKSPIFTQFLETLSGLYTLRALGWTDAMIEKNNTLLDTSQRPMYLLALFQAWLVTTLSVVTAILAVLVVTLATHLRSNAGLVGASLISLMSFGVFVGSMVQVWTMLELAIGAVSRLDSFCSTIKSEHGDCDTERPPENWPFLGAVELKNVSASYHQENEDGEDSKDVDTNIKRLALRNITLTISAGEKVAIVGRTGSGKSSIILLLLRLLDPLLRYDQAITIDGTPLQTIERNILRQRIIAIPQDPFFLPDGSSYRDNLSPSEHTSTAECEAALEQVGLWTLIRKRGGLDEPLNADLLSQGQKQLFSIARAVLRGRARTKAELSDGRIEKDASPAGGLLLLDEVTASVDGATDELIQKIIRMEFEGYTVIAVTHREGTVKDFDRMIIMEDGLIKEDRVLK